MAGSGADGGSKNGKAKPGDKTGEAGPGDSNGKAGRISRGGKTGRSGKDGKAGRSGKAGKDGASSGSGKNGGLKRPLYEKELFRLQAELVKLQEWVRAERARIVVVFEGRDAAGKGSTIKRVTQFLNPRIAQIVALPAPTEREQTEWYFQRYIRHLPAGGHIVLFDRSWYNRAGVERVMGFCTKEEYGRFLHQCPLFERMLVEDGILLRKYWFSVSDEEQLSTIPYQDVQRMPLSLPPRPPSKGYIRMPKGMQTYVPDYAASLASRDRHPG